MANYLPFNSIDHDRVVKAEDWAWYFATFIGNGVFPKPTNGLQVLADGDMNVAVKAGCGFINGYAFRNQDDYVITIDVGDGSLNRIDRIVLRWDLTNRQMLLAVKKGTPSASPSAPALTRTADTYELALADISVPRGLTTISQSHITDRRTDPDLCGIVEGTVSQIDWATLTAQLDAFMAEYSAAIVHDYNEYVDQIETFESTFEHDANEWMTAQQEDFADYVENFEEDADDWMSGEQTAFEAWVQTLHDILDTETASHLQNEIEALQAEIGVPEVYDPDETYNRDDLCVHNGKMYFATDDNITGTWDSTKWHQTTVLEEIDRRIDLARDQIFGEMTRGRMAIDSRVLAGTDTFIKVTSDGAILAARQTITFNIA